MVEVNSKKNFFFLDREIHICLYQFNLLFNLLLNILMKENSIN